MNAVGASVDYRILFTRPGGLVTVAGPTLEAYRACTGGGVGRENWHMRTRGWMDAAIHAWTIDGVPETAAARWTRAVAWGGMVDAEFNETVLATERCTPVKLAPEILRLHEVPSDRWFRDAWRRNERGGPIFIDMATARALQADAMLATLDKWNAQAQRDDRRSRLLGRRTNGPATIDLDFDRYSLLIDKAATPAALKAVWPEDLPRPAMARAANKDTENAKELRPWRN
jgi:hypothetical protein